MYLELERLSDNGVQTTGLLSVKTPTGTVVARFDTLELSWKNNQRQISCIPDGMYCVVPNFSFKHGTCFRLSNVLGRDNILIHKGNFNKDTKGCILIGHGFEDIDNDHEQDILNSRIAMTTLLGIVKAATTITIKTKFLGHELK